MNIFHGGRADHAYGVQLFMCPAVVLEVLSMESLLLGCSIEHSLITKKETDLWVSLHPQVGFISH